MTITLLDPHDKTQLWEVKQHDNQYFYRAINDQEIGTWQEKKLKEICKPYGCGSWYSLQKHRINTSSFRGWKGFGYRKSAYSTWLVDSYFNKQPQALKLKQQFARSDEFNQSQPHLPELQKQVRLLGINLFEDLHSFSSYGDFEIVNWREIAFNWIKNL
ncbi:MAG: hypothetical protein V7782_05950 [Psychromonas sp.]